MRLTPLAWLMGVATAALVLATSCGGDAADGGQRDTSPAGTIAFLRFEIEWPGPPAHPLGPQDRSDIYVINADGSGEANLTDQVAGYADLSWSPDGTRLMFSSNRDGNVDVYVMNADGTGLANLTVHPAEDIAPIWSPDGTRIAFASFREGGPGLFVMGADGFSPSLVASGVALHGACPLSWSPDGQRIAVARGGASPDIFVVNADGSGLTQLTDHPLQEWCPSWSPDGSKVLFQRGAFPPNDVYVMGADGSQQADLTPDTEQHDDLFPAWSPAGRIVFRSNRDGFAELYVMDADGSNVVKVTSTRGEADNPSWSPDGAHLAYDSEGDIHIVQADGSGKRKVTDTASIERLPAWSPER